MTRSKTCRGRIGIALLGDSLSERWLSARATADGADLAPAGIVGPGLLFEPDVTLDTLETAPVFTEL
jgi:hypothetical protein